ncbi:MAG TPA: hypothetical protein VKT52_09215, partial [Ktedonobacterales bacterium]|nr:hypothetical protein [Ktedonobacterales bacterium]
MTFAHVQQAHPIPLALGASVSNGTQDLPALLSAVEWLAVCILCALIYWGFVRRVYRRRRHRRPMNRGALFLAFFLVAFAGGNLLIADMFAPREPLFFLPIAGFFLLFFYLFSDGRYTPIWARWLVLLYGITQIGALIPSDQNQNQNNPQFDQFVAHIPSVILTVG